MRKTRTRVVNCRLSEEEYGAIVRLCEAEGAHSLSEFLRSAFGALISTPKMNGIPLEVRLQNLSRQVERMHEELQQLAVAMRKNPELTAARVQEEIDEFCPQTNGG